MVLEHLVVAKAARADKLAQAELDDILRYGAKELFADDEEEAAAAAATATAAAAEGDDAAAAAAGADGNGATAGGGAEQDAAGGTAAAAACGKSALRIVWDDAALERLLDRSQVEAAAAAAGEEAAAAAEEDEFTKAFKVRRLWRASGLGGRRMLAVDLGVWCVGCLLGCSRPGVKSWGIGFQCCGCGYMLARAAGLLSPHITTRCSLLPAGGQL
jgi:hypothetical protein